MLSNGNLRHPLSIRGRQRVMEQNGECIRHDKQFLRIVSLFFKCFFNKNMRNMRARYICESEVTVGSSVWYNSLCQMDFVKENFAKQ